MTEPLVHKIAVLCKDYYVIRTIDDLFIFAGADRDWWREPSTKLGGARIVNVYGWIEGIEQHASEQLEKILQGVAIQLAEDERIPEGDRMYLRRQMNLGAATQHGIPDHEKASEFPKDVQQLLER